MNIDARDAQDNPDGTLLHEMLTPAMIRPRLAEVH